SVASSAAGQIKNTMLGEIAGGDGPCAAAVAVNPRNPANVVVVSGRGEGYVTKDGGSSWTTTRIASEQERFFGDPVLFADDKGGYYMFHAMDAGEESESARLLMRRSGDGGETWTQGDPVLTDASRRVQTPWAIRDGK